LKNQVLEVEKEQRKNRETLERKIKAVEGKMRDNQAELKALDETGKLVEAEYLAAKKPDDILKDNDGQALKRELRLMAQMGGAAVVLIDQFKRWLSIYEI